MKHCKMIEKARELFVSWCGHPAQVISRAPGRVNLIGEHTDYNGGYVLPFALHESVYLAARISTTDGHFIRVRAADLNETGTLDTEGNILGPHARWLSYPKGVVSLLTERGLKIPPSDILITSDLPVGTGVSSSAAVTVAFINLFLYLNSCSLPDLEIARLAQRVENEFAGVQCGIMDPLASQAGKKDSALLIDCTRFTTDYIPIHLPDQTLVLINTGVHRQLEQSAYNTIRAECETAARLLSVEYLSMVSREQLEQEKSRLEQGLYFRVLHVIEENSRVRDAASALIRSDYKTLGNLLQDSHKSLRDLYRVSCKELDLMVDIASRIPGWHGGRMVGAGFGGCTVHLVDKATADEFMKAVCGPYESMTGIHPHAFEVIPSEGASCQSLT